MVLCSQTAACTFGASQVQLTLQRQATPIPMGQLHLLTCAFCFTAVTFLPCIIRSCCCPGCCWQLKAPQIYFYIYTALSAGTNTTCQAPVTATAAAEHSQHLAAPAHLLQAGVTTQHFHKAASQQGRDARRQHVDSSIAVLRAIV